MEEKEKPKEFYDSIAEWKAEGEKIFGTENPDGWTMICPACKRKQTQQEFKEHKDNGATADSFVKECLGRYTGGKKGPHKCDWAAFGLFRGPVLIKKPEGEEGDFIAVFDFYRGK
jgi:hypothetical protein